MAFLLQKEQLAFRVTFSNVPNDAQDPTGLSQDFSNCLAHCETWLPRPQALLMAGQAPFLQASDEKGVGGVQRGG